RFRVEVDGARDSWRRFQHADRQRQDGAPCSKSLRISEYRDMASLPLDPAHGTRELCVQPARIDAAPKPTGDRAVSGQDAKLRVLGRFRRRVSRGGKRALARAIEKRRVVALDE